MSINRIIQTTILITVLISTVNAYERLSRRDKKEFNRTYQDLILAISEENYKGFELLAPGFIEKYKDVMIDPESENLRSGYLKVEAILDNMDEIKTLKKYTNELDGIDEQGVSIEEIKRYNQVLNYLKDKNRKELFKKYFKRYKGIFLSYMDNEENIENLKGIDYMPGKLKDRLRERLGKNMKEDYMKLTCNLNIDSVREFEDKYPEMYEEEIAQLKDKIQKMDRLAVLRGDIDVHKISRYYEKYPETDDYLNSKLKKKYEVKIRTTGDIDLYREYRILFGEEEDNMSDYVQDILFDRITSGEIEPVKIYVKLFPDGKYIDILKEEAEGNNEESSVVSSNSADDSIE